MIPDDIQQVNINAEMQQSYLDYAMSVIVSRALPDARDGLKPVQRRILYAMYDMGIRDDSPHKKSARIVGEVLGKYHPHGDSAVYEAMARMAQDFSMRYMMVDGQGNFGSIDGDPPAAMRYTEARLSSISLEALQQLELDTVDFNDNFDGSLKEPAVLPSAIPSLLINGATGIAVGMATNIPPHNLGEVVDALVMMLNRWEQVEEVSIDDIMRHIKGPDFPTGGMIIQEDSAEELSQIYAAGHGLIPVRARVSLEEMSRGRQRIIVHELPYSVNKASLIERIADLVRTGSLEGISDLRDESDRQGMRIVIDLNKNADTDALLKQLYKRTSMHTTFGVNILALVDGSPQRLSLKQALRVFAEHRLEVVRRRSEFLLRKHEARLHILKALRIAVDNIEVIIRLIRKAKTVAEARDNLMSKYKLDEIQADAILEMPLRRLAALERQKIEDEFKEVSALIADLKDLLASDKRMRQVIIDELKGIKLKYGDVRRTQIIRLGEGEKASTLLTQTDVMPVQDFWVELSDEDIISRTEGEKANRLGGEKAPRLLLRSNSHQTLFLVTNTGKAVAISALSVPVQKPGEEGAPVNKVAPLHADDNIQAIFSVPMDKEAYAPRYVLTVSRRGLIKRSLVSDLPGASVASFVLCKVNAQDDLFAVLLTNGQEDLLLTSANGMAIRFNESEVRAMGLVAAGVNAIKLREDDILVGASTIDDKAEVAVLTQKGLAKRMDAPQFPVQGRYGQGVVCCKLDNGDQIVAVMVGGLSEKSVCHFRKSTSRVFILSTAIARKRASNGQSFFALKAGDELIGCSALTDYSDYWNKAEL